MSWTGCKSGRLRKTSLAAVTRIAFLVWLAHRRILVGLTNTPCGAVELSKLGPRSHSSVGGIPNLVEFLSLSR